jgi:hypothetical protein
MLADRIQKQSLERNLGGRSLQENREIDGKMKCGTMLPNYSILKTGMQRQDTGVTGGRKQGRPWPRKGPKSHRNKKNVTTTTMNA